VSASSTCKWENCVVRSHTFDWWWAYMFHSIFRVKGLAILESYLLLDTCNINFILQFSQEHTQLWGIPHLITSHTHDCTGQILYALKQCNGWAGTRELICVLVMGVRRAQSVQWLHHGPDGWRTAVHFQAGVRDFLLFYRAALLLEAISSRYEEPGCTANHSPPIWCQS
jgi:hypothetical protein